jgi:hypothetical protein
MTRTKLSAKRAVLYGHLIVNLPVLLIIAAASLLGFVFRGLTEGFCGLIFGALTAWLWWSATVSRWREWARRSGADAIQTQLLAERTGLVWPEGSLFAKTEFKLQRKK